MRCGAACNSCLSHAPAPLLCHVLSPQQQVFLHKRAQIYVADLHGAFGGQGLGAFGDIAQLTMFADYRVSSTL